MSSKSSKSPTSDFKSKTKAVLLMLEKLMSGGNPDKEQTKYLCQKLLHLVNNHESSKKEVSSKSGLETILSTLETCGDQSTCLTLVNTLSEIAAGNGVKRLVSHDVTRVLLHTVAYLGKDADNRLLSALLGLSVKIAPKDRRFALRVRLAGALPVLISIVRSTASHSISNNRLLSNTLLCLKICSANGVNASVLGRLGVVHVLHRLVQSMGRKQPALTKTALSTLSILVKSSRSNVSHAISCGLLAHVLSIHQDWHKNDLRNHRHIPARKSMLNIVKHVTAHKSGKKAFIEADGVQILHRTTKECNTLPCPKAAEALLIVATLILKRCQPRFRLPIPTVQCSFKFQVPESETRNREEDPGAMTSTYVDDVIDDSDEDDDEDAGSDSLENCSLDPEVADLEDAKQQPPEKKTRDLPIIIPPLSTGITPKRSPDDLRSMYEQYFPELQDFKLDEATLATENISHRPDATRQPNTNSVFPELVINGFESSKGDKKSSGNLKHQSSIPGRRRFSSSVPSHHLSTFFGVTKSNSDSSFKIYSSNNTLDTQEGLHPGYKPPQSAPAPATRQDSFLRAGPFLPIIDDVVSHRSANSCALHGSSDKHALLMSSLAGSTKSEKQQVNTVSYADMLGHVPFAFPEPQVLKRYGIQRSRMLDDVGRTLGQGDIINKVVYTRDCGYRPPKANNYWTYDVVPPKTTTHKRESLARRDSSDNVDSTVRNQNPKHETPAIEDAYAFLQEEPEICLPAAKLPCVSCGCGEDFFFPTSGGDEAGCDTQKSPLKFRSDFECGNLRTAIQVREREYDLILDADCNSNHHHQWFYFEVSEVTAGVPYRFNIVNCEKSSSQFNFGMQPLMYSVTEARIGQPCWRRAGANLCYYKSHFSRSAVSAGGVKGRSYFTMSFTITFQHDKDVCYFSYHYPYTYTQMQADLQDMVAQVDESEMYVRVQTFCHTLGGNAMPVLTVTAPPEQGQDEQDAIREFRSRPYVFLSARVHPGESNSSWTMRGTLKLLLASGGESNPAKLDIARELRRSYIFKVVPMLNPDGVINGHHRCSLTGEDLNRQWIDPDPNLFPTIYHTKGLLQYLHSIGKAPLVYCDYHGHSRRKNVFMYGCSRRESILAGESEAISGAPDDVGYKTLPKLLHQMAPAFSLANCSFVVERCKESTARVVVWKEMGVTRSYTMESTYNGCDQGKYKGYQIGTFELEEMGEKVCEALLHLKVKDRARRLPFCDLDPDDMSYPNDNGIEGSRTRETDFAHEWGSALGHTASDYSCPVNTDEELTPDDVGSVSSYEGPSGVQLPTRIPEGSSGGYGREFWDFNEFCRGFGFGPEDDDPNNEMTVTSSADVRPTPATRFSLVGDRHALRSPAYQICTDTGRVIYSEEPPGNRISRTLDVDLSLSSMLRKANLEEPGTGLGCMPSKNDT